MIEVALVIEQVVLVIESSKKASYLMCLES